MSLEAYTGKIKDLVITNPTPTDPKSQGDDHLRGIKKTMFDDAVRVSGSPLQQMGDKATAGENHYWDASTANQLSLKRGTPDAPGAELIKALNGVLSFPNQGQLLAGNGYIKLPGGVIVQWGITEGTGQRTVTFPIPFPNAALRVIAAVSDDGASETVQYSATTSFVGPSGCRVTPQYNNGSAIGIAGEQAAWIAIGY